MKLTMSSWGAVDASGSTNGQTALKTLGGLALRHRVTPVNRRSPKQMSSRNRTGTNAQAWGGLTEEQRQTWIQGAPNFPVVKKGVTHLLRGNTLYTRLNNNLLWAGQPVIAECPLPEEMPVFGVVSVAAAAGTPSYVVTFSGTTAPMGFSVMVRATTPQPPGRYNISNKLTTVGKATVAMSTDDMTTEYTSEVGTLIEGYKILTEVVIINDATGQKSAPTVVTTIIAA